MLHLVASTTFFSFFCNRSQEIQKKDDYTEDTDSTEEPLTTAAKKKKKTKVKDAMEPQSYEMSSSQTRRPGSFMQSCSVSWIVF